MRIQELRLIRYGKFTDRTLALPFNARDIHLVVGPNEAGKSTVRSAIGDWLFGIPMRTPLAFLHPMPELRLGGVLERRDTRPEQSEVLTFDRTKGNKNTLRTPEDTPLADSVLQAWLGNLQAQTFNRMYALDHATLVEGGAGILSASDDLGRMLFQSASGIEHLGDALKKLQDDADTLWAPRKSGTRAYYQAHEAYEAAQAAFKRSTLRTKDWKAHHDALTATEAQLAQAKALDVELRRQLSRLERIRRVRPLLQALDTAHAKRTELLATGDLPLLEENAAQVFADALQDIALANANITRLQHSVTEIQAKLQGINIDENLLTVQEEITELNERRLQFRAHRTDILKRQEEMRLEWVRLQNLARGLGWPANNEDEVRKRIPAAPLRNRLASLIKTRATLAQDLKNAEASLSGRRQQIRHAETELSTLTAGSVDPDLALTFEQAMKLGDHENVMAQLHDEINELTRTIEAAMDALGAWRQPPTSLRTMLVPDTAHVQQLIDQQRTDAAEEKTCRDALDSKKNEIAQLQLDLHHFVRTFQPVSRDEVMAIRRARDNTWHEIKRAPQSLPQHCAPFEEQMAQADQLADDRLERAQHEADRQSRADALERKQLECLNLENRLESVKRRMAERLTEWEALAAACSLPALPLAMAPTWLEARQNVLDLLKQHSSCEQRRSKQAATAAQLGERLWRQLGRTTPAPDLGTCLQQARALITQSDQAQGQRKTLEQQIREGQRSLVTLQETLDTAQSAWTTWQQSWLQAVQSMGYDADAPVDQVEAEMTVMHEIERLLDRIRTIRSERIETMQADLDGLAATAARLAARVAPDLSGQSPEDTALELTRRLDLARKALAETTELQTSLGRSQTELDQARLNLHSVHARLAPLMAAAGVEEITDLGRAIERSDQRRQVENTIRTAEQALTQAADGLSLDELRTESESIGADELKAELDRLSAESRNVVEQIATLSNAFGAQKSAFDALDGTDQAARAEAQRQEAIAAMADAAERYVGVQTAARLLKWSIEKFRETRQGPMLAKASALFSRLTMGSFNRLLVDSEGDTPRLFGIRPDGKAVDVTGMSEGSRDQLYLALRLAALELQVEQGLALPLVADDLFINFDDQRTAAGLAVLGELSRTMQVVFLTHHDHLVPLAQKVLGPGLNVVWL